MAPEQNSSVSVNDISMALSESRGTLNFLPTTLAAHLTASVEQNTALSADDFSMALAGSHGALNLASPTAAAALDAVVGGYNDVVVPIIRFKEHKEGPTDIPSLSQGIALKFIGAALAEIPGLFHY
jgi:hypothetical protein